MLQNFQNTVVSSSLDALFALFIPPTLADYADPKAQLDTDVAASRKLILVAHSQGNLFVNQAYDYVQPRIGSNLVKVVHIAPASPTLRGQWVLANLDLAINGLRFWVSPSQDWQQNGPLGLGSGYYAQHANDVIKLESGYSR